MINNYTDFKERMKRGGKDDIDELVHLKKSKPFTFGEYQKKYQKEKREIEEIKEIR